MTEPSSPEDTATNADAESAEAPRRASPRIVALVVVAAGLFFWVVQHFDNDGAEMSAPGLVRLALGAENAEASFRLGGESVVDAWANIDVVHEGISPRSPNEDLPHVLDYVIEVRDENGSISPLRCNPFDSNYARTSGVHNSIGEPSGRYYDGRIENCAVRLPAGSYTVRARAESVGEGDPRIRFEKNELVLRAR